MGGQSFKCPYCDQWFLQKVNLRAHLIAKHKLTKGFEIKGVAENVSINRSNDRDYGPNARES